MDTKTALLESAERLARQRGFDAFSYADLSKEVGIRKASIHHHFPTKADLAAELMIRYRESFMASLDDIARTEPTAGAQLTAYFARYKAAMNGGAQVCLCVSFSVSVSSFDAPVVRQINRFHAESLAWLERLFELAQRDGSIVGVVDPAEDAQACLAVVEGAQLVARASGDLADFDAAIRTTVRRVV
ncbi:TetR/AcrR family transcriptional regulator [Roseobacter sinensis]|uniref:TetR/AcrR family transcriptional regulator n=1 Tax=Roseobacter sinensis TaxID=2931391 RepID=A0ABT3B9G3_9RHOB|nr:TetR/AcrR family transcriptional regulator [Roseobacter sp. WL0113]MCV3270183.1 TetR/AcrR family transcriptional regulator [Roseobacter sp. WL0113]